MITVTELQKLAAQTPPEVIAGFDVNGDGLLCSKFLPELQDDAVRGTAVDNTKRQKRS